MAKLREFVFFYILYNMLKQKKYIIPSLFCQYVWEKRFENEILNKNKNPAVTKEIINVAAGWYVILALKNGQNIFSYKLGNTKENLLSKQGKRRE